MEPVGRLGPEMGTGFMEQGRYNSALRMEKLRPLISPSYKTLSLNSIRINFPPVVYSQKASIKEGRKWPTAVAGDLLRPMRAF